MCTSRSATRSVRGLRSDPVGRPTRPARSGRHRQLHQEHSDRRRRRGHDQQIPFPRRGLRHGTHDGPHRYAGAQPVQLRRRKPSCTTCRSFTCSRSCRSTRPTAGMIMRGLYVGDDMETFTLGAQLSQKVNLDLLDKPLTEGAGLSRSARIQEHLAGQQGNLSHPHGDGRRRRTHRSRSRL